MKHVHRPKFSDLLYLLPLVAMSLCSFERRIAAAEPLALPKGLRPIGATAFSGDGLLALANNSTEVVVWNLAKAERVSTFEPTDELWHLAAFSPDARLLVVSSRKDVHIYEASKGTVKGSLKGRRLREDDEYKPNVQSLAFSADGKRLAVGYDYGDLVLYDTVNWRELDRVKPAESKSVVAIQFSPDGKLIAMVCWSGDSVGAGLGMVYIWDIAARRSVGTFVAGKRSYTNHFAWARDGKRLILWGSEYSSNEVADGRMDIATLETETWQEIDSAKISDHARAVTMKLTSDEKVLLLLVDLYNVNGKPGVDEYIRELRFYQLPTKTNPFEKLVKTMPMQDVEYLQISPNDKHMLTSMKDGRVLLHDFQAILADIPAGKTKK